VLGRGAMGVVYKAHDPAIDRPVAIKLVRADLLDGDERAEYLARFQREAQAAGRCTHPNIVAIYDYAVYEGNPFLAMEYVEGASLSQVLARTGHFAPGAAVQVMLQVLDALGRAHSLGIVHRDVKPANILLRPDGRVMMTDFGISRIESVGITQIGTVIGTPSYMSPEQCRGDPVDGRSDIYSAGAVLYELLSGERPFAGRNATEVTHRVLTETPADLRRKVSGISDSLAGVADRALAKSANDRFLSAAAMAEALRRPNSGAPLPEPPDATVLTPASVPGFDEAVLATIERRLAEHVGPIARHLVRNAARHAASTEAIVTEVSRHIAGPADRDRFTRQALGGQTEVRALPGAIAPAALERVQRELTVYVGPIARVLVRRAAERAKSEQELRQLLAAHLDRQSERDAFLARS